jgi:hypothetical protein
MDQDGVSRRDIIFYSWDFLVSIIRCIIVIITIIFIDIIVIFADYLCHYCVSSYGLRQCL